METYKVIEAIDEKSDPKLEVTKEETVTKVQTYDYGFLVRQKDSIEKQKAEQIAQRDKELKEVDDLIAKCKELKIDYEIKETQDVGP